MLHCPNCTYAPDETMPGRSWEQCDDCARLEAEAEAMDMAETAGHDLAQLFAGADQLIHGDRRA